jgi:hypothetical protein
VPHPGAPAGIAAIVAAIGVAVVGHDSLDGNAVAANQASAPREDGDGAGLALIRQDLGVGQARGVIDGDVQVFPADAAVAVTMPGRRPVIR